MSVLGFSLASSLKSSRGLYKFLKPIADSYANLAGYRQHGMKYDDLLIEENPTVQKVRFLISLEGIGGGVAISYAEGGKLAESSSGVTGNQRGEWPRSEGEEAGTGKGEKREN